MSLLEHKLDAPKATLKNATTLDQCRVDGCTLPVAAKQVFKSPQGMVAVGLCGDHYGLRDVLS